MVKQEYTYRATLLSVYDGDTITVRIHLGLNVESIQRIRLIGIDAPEMRGVERERGKISRDYLQSLLDGGELIIKTFKDKKGKYGRYLGEVWAYADGRYANINELMVEAGQAEVY